MPKCKYRPLPPMTAERLAYFYSHVPNRPDDGCWEWGSPRHTRGYGVASFNQVKFLASRVAYFVFFGIDPMDRGVLHSCDNPPCCRGSHLFLGDQADNLMDCAKKLRTGGNKLVPEQVLDLRKLHTEGWSTVKLARHFEISQANAWDIVNRNTWAWL